MFPKVCFDTFGYKIRNTDKNKISKQIFHEFLLILNSFSYTVYSLKLQLNWSLEKIILKVYYLKSNKI